MIRHISCGALAPAPAASVSATTAVSAETYARAEKFLMQTTTPLTKGGSVSASWLPDERLWYHSAGEIILVDPVAKSKTICDEEMCSGLGISMKMRGPPAAPGAGPPLSLSPDGMLGAFVHNWNLWVKDVV